MLSPQITKVISTDNKSYLWREQNVISGDNKGLSKPTADVALREPKEIKENIKKNKESAKPEKEILRNSFSVSLNHKSMNEAEVIERLKRDRVGVGNVPQVYYCSVCQEMKRMVQNNRAGYLICMNCLKKGWLYKVY